VRKIAELQDLKTVGWSTWGLTVFFILIGIYELTQGQRWLFVMYPILGVFIILSETHANKTYRRHAAFVRKIEKEMVDAIEKYQGRSSKNDSRDEGSPTIGTASDDLSSQLEDNQKQ